MFLVTVAEVGMSVGVTRGENLLFGAAAPPTKTFPQKRMPAGGGAPFTAHRKWRAEQLKRVATWLKAYSTRIWQLRA